MHEHYSASDLLVVDMNDTDVVNSPEDAERVVRELTLALALARSRRA